MFCLFDFQRDISQFLTAIQIAWSLILWFDCMNSHTYQILIYYEFLFEMYKLNEKEIFFVKL